MAPSNIPVKRKVQVLDAVVIPSKKKRKVQERTPSPTPESEGYMNFPRTPRHRSLSIDSMPPAGENRYRSRSIDSVLESPTLLSQPHSRSRSIPPLSRSHSLGRCLLDAVVISPSSSLPVPIYRPFHNEVAETNGLEIPGEFKDPGRGLPVRNLDQFTFYGHDGKYLPFALISRSIEMNAKRTILATGVVTRCLEDPEDGDSDIESVDTELLVSLQPLEDFWVDYNDGQPNTVWIATQAAWYILQEPDCLYAAFYQPFWVAHHLTSRVSDAAREDSKITLERFSQDFLSQEKEDVLLILGRELVTNDLKGEYTTLYIIDQLISVDDVEEIFQTPLLQILVRRASDMDVTLDDLFDLESIEPHALTDHGPNQTVTMPLVHELTTGIFLTTLLKAGKDLDDEERHHNLLKAPESPEILHPDSPTNVEWEEPAKGFPGYFGRVCLDGEIYNIGDVVMVNPGEDDLEHRAKSAIEACSRSGNALHNKVWFCKIIYMHNKRLSGSAPQIERVAHVQWYLDGAKTILQETAHPYGLFALAECADVPVGAILGRCTVQHLKPGDQEPNAYHCSFLWDADQCRFLDQAILAEQGTKDNGHPSCPCCTFNAKREEDATQETLILSKNHATVRGIDYHKDDFVYISATSGSPYIIGQIRRFLFNEKLRLEDTHVELTLLGRYDDVARAVEGREGLPSVKKDELRLFMTEQVESYPLTLLEAKCFVHVKDKTNHPAVGQTADHFYVDRWANKVNIYDLDDLVAFRAHAFAVCKTCTNAEEKVRQKLREYMECQSPLRTMELFAGAGGLSTGLEQSGFVKTRWAVEMSSGAASTFQANHPGARVYNQDTNACLQSAIDVRENKPYKPLFGLADKKELPPMPQRGDVDLITGGFPCQSFSGMNHHKRFDDIRTTLVANMLSYVEFYRPQYVLMENVKGLLQHHIKGGQPEHDQDEDDVGGGGVIKMGIVKFVLRALTCLGYQAQLKVLQASEYGSPQRRERVIFWGTRRAHVLPEYPLPTHVAWDYRVHVLNLPTHDKLIPSRRSDRGCAPFRALVIADAISDLPCFDWKNPRKHNTGTSSKKKRQQFPELSAVSTTGPLTGFLEPVDYASPPKTRYQKMIRGDQTQVTLHCSRTFQEPIVARVWSVCGDGVNGPNDIPRSLWTPVMKASNPEKLKRVWRQRFTRLQWNEPFSTALTSCHPFSKGSRLLHPTQRRILTARECARSQGFPDYYEFVQTQESARPEAWARLLDDIHKQIGNAVPVQLARALGDSLGKALFTKWLEGQNLHFDS